MFRYPGSIRCLRSLPLDAIAVATCFVRRTPRDITPLAFLAALCLEATGSTPTLAMCAVRAALVSLKSRTPDIGMF